MECIIVDCSVCLVQGDQFVSFHEVLTVGVGPLVHRPAQNAGNVEEADGEAAVENLNWSQGCDGVDQLGRDEDDLCLESLGLEDLSWCHDVHLPHDPQHQLVHPVVSVSGQASECKLQTLVSLDPGSQDQLHSDEVEDLPEEIEHHGQHKGLSQGERFLRQIQFVGYDAPSENEE